MRVISGTAKGHKLVAPKGQRVRPALDKVKGAIFNILFDVSDARALDLFAGSGAIGIEALSRGAAQAVFVEEWSEAVAAIRRNLDHCKVAERGRVLQMKVERAIKLLGREGVQFDLVFVDPPYLKDLVNPTLRILTDSRLLHDGSLVIVEHHPKEPIDPPEGLALTDSRKYGQTLISFLARQK
ncbi:MAG: 16S rRNA (guanine(966)-N(2))-methyltransferase RsmD [bacterium]